VVAEKKTEQKKVVVAEKKVEPAQVRWKVYFSDGSHAEVMARDSTEAIQEGIKLSELVIQVEKVVAEKKVGNSKPQSIEEVAEEEGSETYGKFMEIESAAAQERAERERIGAERERPKGWINFATTESKYVGVPNQKVWYNSDTIFSLCGATFVHVVKCNKRPRNNDSRGDPRVWLEDGTVVRGDWVGFGKHRDVWAWWTIGDSDPKPIGKGSVIGLLFEVLSKQPQLGAKTHGGIR
jgi:hypothetical protein